ncbi:flagellar biosynthesis anti-sigma factor FlgM [uncultured Nitrospira sp.]|uniref:flagellar biosynthesis anti-sigma factor FlgM n=1 Tax=uncultured Nitrospira sp. TaxID=157176 RepID=UPI0031403524
MTIRGLDPSGELGKLLFHVQAKNLQTQEASPPRATHHPSSADPVDLSVLAQEIRDYSIRVAKFPEVREDKIKRIQQALETGAQLGTSNQVADALTRETILNELGSK